MAGMTLAQLRAAGGIVPREPVKKQVTWKHVDPSTGEDVEDVFDVYIVRQSYGSYRDTVTEKDRDQVAAAFSKCLMLDDAKGKPALISYEDAYQLDISLAAVLLEAVREVNGQTAKNLNRAMNSSVSSSPEASAEEPSKKPAKP